MRPPEASGTVSTRVASRPWLVDADHQHDGDGNGEDCARTGARDANTAAESITPGQSIGGRRPRASRNRCLAAPTSGVATRAPGMPPTAPPMRAATIVVGAVRSTDRPTTAGWMTWFSIVM